MASIGCGPPEAPPRIEATQVSTTAPSQAARHDSAWRLVGVGSCTASGCHGGGSATTIQGSEYNIWISEDPHADAHSVLYDKASLRMLQRLDGKKPTDRVAPYADARCLGCHSTTAASPRDPSVNLLSDGVGCEACHGPAEGWISIHYEHRFKPNAPTGSRPAWRERGMWDTDDLATRAAICAGCHVGGEGRDVNHDLIAAGHPRLQFGFGAFYRELPVHWDASEDRQAWGANLDAMTWAIGQAVNSQAALRQLSRRAGSGASWPELSEWSCGACHHDLRDDTARQQRLAERGGLSGLKVEWDDWNHHLPRQYMTAVERAWGLNAQLAEEIQTDMDQLAQAAGDFRANRRQIAQQSAALAAKMDQWISRLRPARPARQAIEQLSRDIIAIQRKTGLTSWSDAALAYDALASLHQSRIHSARFDRSAKADIREYTTAIGELHAELSRLGSDHGYAFRPETTAQLMERLARLLDGEGDSP